MWAYNINLWTQKHYETFSSRAPLAHPPAPRGSPPLTAGAIIIHHAAAATTIHGPWRCCWAWHNGAQVGPWNPPGWSSRDGPRDIMALGISWPRFRTPHQENALNHGGCFNPLAKTCQKWIQHGPPPGHLRKTLVKSWVQVDTCPCWFGEHFGVF